MAKDRIVIMGAAGRDFHNFNVLYRNNERVEVVAFSAAQIPDIEGRVYPASLSGDLYPNGVPIIAEAQLKTFLREKKIDACIFSYSDISYEAVMQKGAFVNSLGADFTLLGGEKTMLASAKPVVAICAVRTGSGKSQTTRKVSSLLRQSGYKVVVIRHPMPYGDLVKQAVQRFATLEDMDKHHCTIEEREEYEHHITNGCVVYAGVDYASILKEAEKEADIVLWDGGNNDLPFYRPDLYITVVDPHRPGHEIRYYPGETNLYLCDVVVVNKIDSADRAGIDTVLANVKSRNPHAKVIMGESPLTVQGDASAIAGKKVLCVEDGPTLTHGEMKYGAAVVAAKNHGAASIVDPRPWATGRIAETFEIYPDIGSVLPAMGYGEEQIADLEETINAVECDMVLVGTPIDLTRLVKINKPNMRVAYRLEEKGSPNLTEILNDFTSTLSTGR
jgi:predicted GTPase